MRVRIEVVIPTAGNDEEYVGKHLGLKLLGRPLNRMVVTFEEELTQEELESVCDRISQKAFRELRNDDAVMIYSVKAWRVYDL